MSHTIRDKSECTDLLLHGTSTISLVQVSYTCHKNISGSYRHCEWPKKVNMTTRQSESDCRKWIFPFESAGHKCMSKNPGQIRFYNNYYRGRKQDGNFPVAQLDSVCQLCNILGLRLPSNKKCNWIWVVLQPGLHYVRGQLPASILYPDGQGPLDEVVNCSLFLSCYPHALLFFDETRIPAIQVWPGYSPGYDTGTVVTNELLSLTNVALKYVKYKVQGCSRMLLSNMINHEWFNMLIVLNLKLRAPLRFFQRPSRYHWYWKVEHDDDDFVVSMHLPIHVLCTSWLLTALMLQLVLYIRSVECVTSD